MAPWPFRALSGGSYPILQPKADSGREAPCQAGAFLTLWVPRHEQPYGCWTMQFWIQLKRLSVVPNKLCTAYILRHFTPPGSLFPNCFLLFMRSQIKLLIICAKIKNERTLSQENWFSFPWTGDCQVLYTWFLVIISNSIFFLLAPLSAEQYSGRADLFRTGKCLKSFPWLILPVKKKRRNGPALSHHNE